MKKHDFAWLGFYLHYVVFNYCTGGVLFHEDIQEEEDRLIHHRFPLLYQKVPAIDPLFNFASANENKKNLYFFAFSGKFIYYYYNSNYYIQGGFGFLLVQDPRKTCLRK